MEVLVCLYNPKRYIIDRMLGACDHNIRYHQTYGCHFLWKDFRSASQVRSWNIKRPGYFTPDINMVHCTDGLGCRCMVLRRDISLYLDSIWRTTGEEDPPTNV